jgi:hypothetical protein
MKRLFEPFLGRMYAAMLLAAAVRVPWRERGEWLREWRSELHYVREACAGREGLTGVREVLAFCWGAFEDARCLRRVLIPRRVPLATTKGSAAQCLCFLAAVIAVSAGVAWTLPGVRAQMRPSLYRVSSRAVLIQTSGLDASMSAISPEQFRAWEQRTQDIFEGFAFVRVGAAVSGGLRVAHASPNLFQLMGLRLRFEEGDSVEHPALPRVVLSDAVWRERYDADEDIGGRLVRIGGRDSVVAGVAPAGFAALPGHADAWLLESDVASGAGANGMVVARVSRDRADDVWRAQGRISAPKPDGTREDFFCLSLAQRTQRPWWLFAFAMVLACLSLPATTQLPLGEYRLSSHKLSWSTKVRRWSFLAAKVGLLMAVTYFVSLDLAYGRGGVEMERAAAIELVVAFCGFLFGLRWALRDSRQRCPVCLGKLTHPARVGQPSRNFLAWYGTELMCVGGHGLLHIPEISTSWFDCQRWLYLDPSWEVLFAGTEAVSSIYF